MTLSARLRTETRTLHTVAERSGIMRSLLRGSIGRESYLELLHNLAAVYDALESELARHANNPVLQGFQFDALRRLPSLVSDINAFSHAGDARPSLVPSTGDYVRHLHELGNSAPAMLVAHAYLRYFGDMYGGQIIKEIVERSVGRGIPGATSFYDFSRVDLTLFKTGFRDAIDTLPERGVDSDTLIDEAQQGYRYHALIFNELAANESEASLRVQE